MRGKASAQEGIKGKPVKERSSPNRPARPRRRRPIDLASLVYLGLIAIAIFFLYPPVISMLTTESQVPELKRKIVGMQNENERLKEEIDFLNTDEGVEIYARKDLGMVEADEESYVVVEEKAEEGEMESAQRGVDEETVWQKIMRFFLSPFQSSD